MQITNEFLADLERKAKVAGEGTWRVTGDGTFIETMWRDDLVPIMSCQTNFSGTTIGRANAVYIAAAQPVNVMAMIAELRALRAQVAVRESMIAATEECGRRFYERPKP